MNDFERRSRPLFPMSIIMELTELSARQIRYYEQNELIHPARTQGRHRLFSFSDIDRLLEIKSLLEKGINLAGIKEIFLRKAQEEQAKRLKEAQARETQRREISYSEIRKRLKNEILHQKPGQKHSLIQGDLSRFLN